MGSGNEQAWKFSPDGERIATGWIEEPPRFDVAYRYDDCRLKVWDTFSGEELCEYRTGSLPWSLEWSAEGTLLVVGCDEGAPQLIRIETATRENQDWEPFRDRE